MAPISGRLELAMNSDDQNQENETPPLEPMLPTVQGIIGKGAFGLFKRFFAPSIDQLAGLLQDQITVLRWQRRVVLLERVEETRKRLGAPPPDVALPLKLAVPFLEKADLEEQPELQAM